MVKVKIQEIPCAQEGFIQIKTEVTDTGIRKRILLAEDNELNAKITITTMTAKAFEEDKKEALANGMNLIN